MSTIQMNANNGVTGNVTLPWPSVATVALVGGVGSVNAQDVCTAILAGWAVLAGEHWPAAQLFHLSIPTGGNWPTSGAVTFPDGTTATITAGAALIPRQWKQWATQMGWSPTPGVSWGE